MVRAREGGLYGLTGLPDQALVHDNVSSMSYDIRDVLTCITKFFLFSRKMATVY